MHEETKEMTCPSCMGAGIIDFKRCAQCRGLKTISVTTCQTAVLIDGRKVKHVAINCRCGTKSISTIPEFVMRELVLYNCPICDRPFSIQFTDAGWVIKGGIEATTSGLRVSGRANPELN